MSPSRPALCPSLAPPARVRLGFAVALAAVAGTGLGLAFDAPDPAASVAAAILLGSAAALLCTPGPRSVCLVAAMAVICLARGASTRDEVLRPSLAAWTGHRIVRGYLVEDAVRVDSGVRLLLDVDSIDEGGVSHGVTGRVQVFVAGDLASGVIREWTAGRSIRAPMMLREPPVLLNPGGPSERWQRLRRPFLLTGSVKSALVIEVTQGPWWHERAAGARAYLRERVAALFPGNDQAGAVVLAILIGDRSWLDQNLERRLQVAGTYHVIAISGGNVALLTAALYVSLRLIVRSARAIHLLTAVTVVTYGWIAGGDPSVTRAVTGAVIYLAVGAIGLVPPALNVLLLVLTLVVVWDPLTVIDAGAWLSFGASLGIIVGAGRVVRWHAGRWTVPGAVAPAWRWVLAASAATLAAEATLWPIGALLFQRVGVAGPLLNLIAIPAIGVLQCTAIVGLAVSSLSDIAAVPAVAAARLATVLIVRSAELLDFAPWLSWRVPPPSAGLAASFYGAALWWVVAKDVRQRRVAGLSLILAAAVIATGPVTVMRRPAAKILRITMLDVGQGDAILLQFPSGQSLLLDSGAANSRFDVGERVVVPALWASGVRRLDWLAVTHADLDHAGGAAAVASIMAPREIWEGVPMPRELPLQRLRAVASTWRQLQTHDRLSVGDVDLEVLNPPRPEWERRRVRNDDSLVIRVRYGDVGVLLPGDIGTDIERQLPLDDDNAPPLRVLKVAHHGSRSSTSDALLHLFTPHVALVSAGRGNAFGHPAPDVLARLQARDVQLFRTDRDGAVVLETDGHAVRVRAMRGKTWTMRVWRAEP